MLEAKDQIEPGILDEIAKALKVPVDAIKNFSEEAAINIISSTLHNTYGLINYSPTFNPLEKYVEALEENKNLYERLLAAEKEKVALLEKMLSK